jgi:hypothetical protein
MHLATPLILNFPFIDIASSDNVGMFSVAVRSIDQTFAWASIIDTLINNAFLLLWSTIHWKWESKASPWRHCQGGQAVVWKSSHISIMSTPNVFQGVGTGRKKVFPLIAPGGTVAHILW